MKLSALKYTILSWVSGLTMVVLFLMPFHAFLTVWAASHFGHYTALRLWKEGVLAVCVAGVLYLLLTDHKIRSHTLSRRLVWVILGYMVLNVVWGMLALAQHDVSSKALGYGLIINLRFLVFFLVTWTVALRLARLRIRWQSLVLWPAVIVVGFALVQEFALAPRFLEHFGYSKHTILPFQYVDNQPGLLRVQSTLRGANPLGAYLLLINCILAELLISKRVTKHKKLLLGFAAASLLALYFTYSRSAWIGLLLGLGAIVWVAVKAKIGRVGLIAGAVAVLLIGGVALGLRHNAYVQDTILHTSEHTKSHITSNGARLNALKAGLSEVSHHPLGDGPGTAGPASVYNNHPARIAENYFIQIGQETGWLGLLLFIVINLGVGVLLYIRRADPLALSLFASLIGLTFVNFLSHAWADDTLAYVWWGLAGIAMVADRKPDGATQDTAASIAK